MDSYVRNVAFDSMLGATYPGEFPFDGRVAKGHLSRLLRWLRRRGYAYVWVVEFQRRGAIHFHILLVGAHPDQAARAEVSAAWYAIVGSGDRGHLRAGTSWHSVRRPRSLGSYLSKWTQKAPPGGFRWSGNYWGHSRGLAPVVVASVEGEGPEVECVARGVRRARAARRREAGLVRRRDVGVVGFTARDCGRVAVRLIEAATTTDSDGCSGQRPVGFRAELDLYGRPQATVTGTDGRSDGLTPLPSPAIPTSLPGASLPRGGGGHGVLRLGTGSAGAPRAVSGQCSETVGAPGAMVRRGGAA